MQIAFPLLVALIGLIVYLIATNPKAAELGRIGFWTGLLAFLLRFSSDVFSVTK